MFIEEIVLHYCATQMGSNTQIFLRTINIKILRICFIVIEGGRIPETYSSETKVAVFLALSFDMTI